MNKYTIIIEETVSDDFEIEANSEKEAVELAIQKYKNCEFVLEPEELVYKQLAIVKENKELEWQEF